MTATTRCKLVLDQKTEFRWNPNSRELVFNAQYDDSIPEDRRFQQATPTATFTMVVDNPAIVESFKVGMSFYVDFTEVPKPKPKPTS